MNRQMLAGPALLAANAVRIVRRNSRFQSGNPPRTMSLAHAPWLWRLAPEQQDKDDDGDRYAE
jgi:hypothetical protein